MTAPLFVPRAVPGDLAPFVQALWYLHAAPQRRDGLVECHHGFVHFLR